MVGKYKIRLCFKAVHINCVLDQYSITKHVPLEQRVLKQNGNVLAAMLGQ